MAIYLGEYMPKVILLHASSGFPVLQKFDVEKQFDRTEALVVNRRRPFQHDIQTPGLDEGQTQLQEYLRRFKFKESRKLLASSLLSYCCRLREIL
jgi:hypothetical protein